MNKSESKYFHTAVRMDEAFLELLEKKDLAYIRVKDICERAGVNRSTFYLHYETISDLLSESVDYMTGQFLTYFKPKSELFVSRIRDCPLEELYLTTPEYLLPYLLYVKEHKRLFRTAVENSAVLQMEGIYGRMFCSVFAPILERYRVPERDRRYIMTFYIRGLLAIIMEWISQDCSDPIDQIVGVIEQCIMRYKGCY